MTKKLLPLALAAATGLAATAAQAVYLNTDGEGQVLIYPYFTVEGGQNTLINVVNTTDKTKAVKVRILEAMNSQEVLDFNLYLSPEDHWSAAIVANDNGGASIVSHDTSCTVPAAISAGTAIEFRNFEYRTDQQNTGVDRTREGYVEIIEMGEVNDTDLEAAILHNNGVPANCGDVVAAWQGSGTFTAGPTAAMNPPAGGLYGYGVLIDPAEGTDATYDAVALEAFSALPVHTDPGSLDPSLDGAVPPQAEIANGSTYVTASYVDGIDAVSAVLMSRAIANDYVLEPSIGAGTDWVVTFPTKRDYVAVEPAKAPFTASWDAENTQSCEQIAITYYDREEGSQQPSGVDFSPLPPAADPLSLCYEANVISFNNSNVLQASDRVAKNLALDSGFVNGWMTIDFGAASGAPAGTRELADTTASPNTIVLNGLPVVGFAVQQYVNNAVEDGVKANYAGLVTHKVTRELETR